jgi:hypothetical protein
MILLLCSRSSATKNRLGRETELKMAPHCTLPPQRQDEHHNPNTISTQGAPLNGRGPREARAMQTESHQPGDYVSTVEDM